ncbi:MAG: hypothetical protein AAF224_12180 [Pseudomonadota bacterium]
MEKENIVEIFQLPSGAECLLRQIKNDIIPGYYLLCFLDERAEPTGREVTEMLTLGIQYAQKMAREKLGDPQAFSILYSGYSARREKGWHVHIVLLGNRWRKAWLYLVLAGKNFLQAVGLRKDDAPKLKDER